MEVPDVRYARSGGVAIAHQIVGEGSRDLVFSPLLSDLHSLWLAPYSRPFLDRLASEVRLIVFDARGTGLSDRPQHARISSLAAPGEVLVSGTVKDLAAGAGFAFEERGEHELKGVPGTWQLYAVVDG